jgi:hypothetical protein
VTQIASAIVVGSASAEDRVLVSTRVVSAAIVPFLLLAFAVLVPWPTDTKRLFAWAIKPTMSAMILGSVYLGGAYFFVRTALARRWHAVAGGFPPVATFAALMGIATILHWDRFIHGNVAFWLWVALYVATPFIVFGVFVRNRREYVAATGTELVIPPLAAAVIVAGGGLALLTSAFLYLFPDEAIDIWPWPLTRLTARMLGAIFALGLAGLGAWHERRWSAARILVQVAGIMVLLILVAGMRARHEFDPSNVLTWLFAAGFCITAAGVVILYLRMELLATR